MHLKLRGLEVGDLTIRECNLYFALEDALKGRELRAYDQDHDMECVTEAIMYRNGVDGSLYLEFSARVIGQELHQLFGPPGIHFDEDCFDGTEFKESLFQQIADAFSKKYIDKTMYPMRWAQR